MGKEAEMGKERLGAATQAPWGFPEPEWSFRVTWSWIEMAEPLYSNMDQPLDVSCPGKWRDLGQRGFLQFRQSSKGLALEDRLLIDSSPTSWGNKLSLKGGLAHHSVCHITTRWLQKKQRSEEPICPVINIPNTFSEACCSNVLGKSNDVLCHNNKR